MPNMPYVDRWIKDDGSAVPLADLTKEELIEALKITAAESRYHSEMHRKTLSLWAAADGK